MLSQFPQRPYPLPSWQTYRLTDSGAIQVDAPPSPPSDTKPQGEPRKSQDDEDRLLTPAELEQLVDQEFNGSHNKEERSGVTDIYVVFPDHYDPKSPGVRLMSERTPFICWFLGDDVPDDQAQMRVLDLTPQSVFHDDAGFLASCTPWPYYRASCRDQGVFFRVGSLYLNGRKRLERIAEKNTPKKEYIFAQDITFLEWIRDTLRQAVVERLFDCRGAECAIARAYDAAYRSKGAGRLVRKYREERGLEDTG